MVGYLLPSMAIRRYAATTSLLRKPLLRVPASVISAFTVSQVMFRYRYAKGIRRYGDELFTRRNAEEHAEVREAFDVLQHKDPTPMPQATAMSQPIETQCPITTAAHP